MQNPARHVSALRCVVAASALGLSASAAAQSTDVLEEIFVVAQKREQDAQRIPVAVSAIRADSLAHSDFKSLEQLTDLHPSVSFDLAQSWENSSLKIRGIGTFGNTRSFEGAVGVFVDGVYRPRSGMVLLDLLDIDRIEVLRGPQGTLFGKNTVAGTVALRSARPSDAAGTDIELGLGNFDLRSFRGWYNTPIGESAAIRIAGSYRKRDGSFVSPDNGNAYDETDRYGFKAQLLLEPTNDLEVHLIADHAESDASCCWGAALVTNGPTAALIDLYSTLNGLSFVQAPDAERTRLQTLNTSPRETVEDSGLTAIVTWDFGGKTLRTITSARDWENSQIETDPDFVAADLFVLSEPASIKTMSQEINLSIPIRENDDVLLGFYFAKEDYESTRYVDTGSDADNYLNALIGAASGAVACAPPVLETDCLFPSGIGALLDDGEFASEYYFQDSDSLGLFAHGTFELPGRFGLVAGLRYSEEDKSGGVENLFWYDSAIARAALAAAGVPDDGTPRNGLDLVGTLNSPTFRDATSETETTGTVSIQYFASDAIMYYAGYHRGYKAGGVNLFREGVVSNATTYLPEFGEGFELGIKTEYWNGKARTNVALFDTEFTDLQINFFTGLEFRTVNTGAATTKGLEVENQLQISDALRLELAATYLDSKFTRIDDPFLSYLVDRETPRAPRWAGTLELTYEKPVGSNLNFFAHGLVSYSGRHYVGADVATEPKAPGYTVYDASIGVTSGSAGWDLVAWCTNCADKTYRTIYFNTTFQPGSYSAYLNDPRQYGLTLRVRL